MTPSHPRVLLLAATLALPLMAPQRGAAQADSLPATPRRTLARAAPWAGAAALAGSALLDRRIAEGVTPGGGSHWHWATRRLNYLGRPQYAVAALGAAWLGGRAAGAPPLSRAAYHTAAALLAAGVANGTLKAVVGRERPSYGDDPARFHPFTREDRWQSFPSGHATVVFSLAASLSEEAHTPWVTAASYGTAALVGWSRVYDDRHWSSDVVGGALVGVASSRLVMHRLHARRALDGSGEPTITLLPLPGGIAVSIAR